MILLVTRHDFVAALSFAELFSHHVLEDKV